MEPKEKVDSPAFIPMTFPNTCIPQALSLVLGQQVRPGILANCLQMPRLCFPVQLTQRGAEGAGAKLPSRCQLGHEPTFIGSLDGLYRGACRAERAGKGTGSISKVRPQADLVLQTYLKMLNPKAGFKSGPNLSFCRHEAENLGG